MAELNQALDITAGITVGNKFYFKTCLTSMGLYCYDMLLQNLRTIEEPKELNEAWVQCAYFGSIKADKYILFFPFFGKHFVFLDTESDKVIYFEKERNSFYTVAVEYEKKVFVFSKKIADIIVFDLSDFSYFYPFDGWSSAITLAETSNIGKNGTKVVIPTEKEDCVVEIDLNSYSVEYKELERRGIIYDIVLSYEDGYILAGNYPVILLWDGKNNYRDINIENKWIKHEITSGDSLFTNAVIQDGKVYFGARDYKKFISLDLKNMQIAYLYEKLDKEIIFLSKMGNEVLLSVIEENKSKKNCTYTEKTGVVDFDKFEMKDSFKFLGAKREYSRSALRFFIEDVVSS